MFPAQKNGIIRRNGNTKQLIFFTNDTNQSLFFLCDFAFNHFPQLISTIKPNSVFWARVLCSLAAEDGCLRMSITLGFALIRSLVFHVCVPECSRKGSGVRPYLWVQEKLVHFRQITQDAGLCLAELLGRFLSDSAFNLLKNFCDIFLVYSRNGRVL